MRKDNEFAYLLGALAVGFLLGAVCTAALSGLLFRPAPAGPAAETEAQRREREARLREEENRRLEETIDADNNPLPPAAFAEPPFVPTPTLPVESDRPAAGQDTPGQGTAGREAPAGEAPGQDTGGKDTPAKEPPAKDARGRTTPPAAGGEPRPPAADPARPGQPPRR